VREVGPDIVNSSRVEGVTVASNTVSDTVYYVGGNNSTVEVPTEEPVEEPEPPSPPIIICDGPCP
jgi:hypothetical protein